MGLPFSAAQFLDVFSQYNSTMGTAGLTILACMGLLATILASCRSGLLQRLASGFVALLWAWAGGVYHWLFFSRINPAAKLFAVVFAVEGVLLLWAGVTGRVHFQRRWTAKTGLGALLIVYAMVGYSTVGYAFGQRYPATPTFGVPCPVVIFTIGILLLARTAPRILLVIPLVWSAIGTVAAVEFGIAQDWALPISGALGLLAFVPRRGLNTSEV